MNNIVPKEYLSNLNDIGPQPLRAVTVPEMLAAIPTWVDRTASYREFMLSAVQTFHELLLRSAAPIGMVDAREFTCRNLNRVLYAQAPSILGMTEGQFTNKVSAIRAVLREMKRYAPRVSGGHTLSPAWDALNEALPTPYRKMALTGFISFCSHNDIQPTAVSDQVLSAYEDWLFDWTIGKDLSERARNAASNWNWAAVQVTAWPNIRLTRAGMRDQYTFDFDHFPASFGADAETYLQKLAGDPDDDGLSGDVFGENLGSGPRSLKGPLRRRTIETRRWQIRQAAGALVRSDVPAEQITSLRSLVEPISQVHTILRFMKKRTLEQWNIAGKEALLRDVRSFNISGVGELLRQIAKHHCRMSFEHVDAIRGMAANCKPEATFGMSEKNARRLTAISQPREMAMLLHLPEYLTRESEKRLAQAKRDGKNPARAALPGMYGTLMEIGLICPLRRSNLANLSLDRHFQWDAKRRQILSLVIPPGEVKNDKMIRWPMPPDSSALIVNYLDNIRPALPSCKDNRYLFPNGTDGPRSDHDLSVETIKRVEALLGVEFNLHLLRHFAVLRFLTRNPGQYGTVRLLLGHAKVETTTKFYAGLEADAAAKQWDDILNADRKTTRATAVAAFSRRGKFSLGKA